MLSAILIEDEMLARERLKVLLAECSVHVLAEFDYAQEALDWLALHPVDIAFVDIGLPEMDGLEFVEVMKRTAKNIPFVVFTTAHEEYALKAFELAAIDYLLKPIKLTRLIEAVDKVRIYHKIRLEQDNQEPEKKGFTQFVINSRNKVINIPWQQARYLKADHKYIILYTMDGKEYVLDKALLYWEEILIGKAIRIHRSILVMVHALEGLFRSTLDANEERSQWCAKVLDLEELLPVSRRQLPLIRKYLNLR